MWITWSRSTPPSRSRKAFSEIVTTILIAIVLVTVVVYLFLQGWRATLIPLLAVPVSLIGTFIIFPVFGFSINTLSLFGLVLAIGLVVDDAIVVVEAVERHIEEGLAPKAAALKAMEEISGPGDRHRAGAFGGVHAHRVHPRNHRPPVSAVRRHHRDFGDPFGLQRADAESRAGRIAAPAETGEPRPAAPILRLVQSRLRPCYQRLHSLVRGHAAKKRGGRWRCWWWPARARAFFSGRVPSSFLPDEDQGYMFMHLQLAECGLAGADRGRLHKDRKDSDAHSGCEVHHARCRLQPAELRQHQLHRVLLRHAGRLEGSHQLAPRSTRRSCST